MGSLLTKHVFWGRWHKLDRQAWHIAVVTRVEWDPVKPDTSKDLNIVKSGSCANSAITTLWYTESTSPHHSIKLMMLYIMRNVCFNNPLKMLCKISRLYTFDSKCVFVLWLLNEQLRNLYQHYSNLMQMISQIIKLNSTLPKIWFDRPLDQVTVTMIHMYHEWLLLSQFQILSL